LLSGRRKSSPAAIFSAETVFPCAKGAAGENGKETLLRKASEADAHVVSFGTRVGGLRPSDTSHRVYRQSGIIVVPKTQNAIAHPITSKQE